MGAARALWQRHSLGVQVFNQFNSHCSPGAPGPVSPQRRNRSHPQSADGSEAEGAGHSAEPARGPLPQTLKGPTACSAASCIGALILEPAAC